MLSHHAPDFKFQLAQALDLDNLPKTIELNNYYIQSKQDGYRVLWANRQFYSKNMHLIQSPKWFRDKMPQDKGTWLDGEMYAGRKCFPLLSRILLPCIQTHPTPDHFVLDPPNSQMWNWLVFFVFDIVNGGQANQTYRLRFNNLKHNFITQGKQNEHIMLIPSMPLGKGQTNEQCIATLKQAFDYIVYNGGEGVIIRDHRGKIEQGKRTMRMMKLKQRYEADAIVLTQPFGRDQTMKAEIKYNNQLFTVTIRYGPVINPVNKGDVVHVRWKDWVFEKGQIRPRFPAIVSKK
jgi:ATP-dependent DNA ligase